ncbi:MAG TPA: TIR domain-containing protein [Saprospiraceae bacterium]|nr:TIR domain-containing protein [Saprospiraceae bacterium]
MRNPYIVGPWVSGTNFYGREAIIEDLLDENHKCIYLIGNRRIGKTSLLHKIEEEVQKISEIPIFLDLQLTPEGGIRRMARSLYEEVLRKSRQFPILERINRENNDICEAISSIANTAKQANLKICLLIDEGEILLKLETKHIQRLQATLQNQSNVRTIIAASKRLGGQSDPDMNQKQAFLLQGWIIKYMPLLSEEEAKGLIAQINNGHGQIKVGEDIQQEIMELAGNHPYLIQYLCDKLFHRDGYLRSIDERAKSIEPQLSIFFQSDFESLSSIERDIMKKLSDKKILNIDEIQNHLNFKKNHFDLYLVSLEKSCYILYKEEKNHYLIANDFLYRWFKSRLFEDTPLGVSEDATLETIKTGLRVPVINIFISYSHKDELYKEELDKHLSTLKRNKEIATWNVRQILPGSEWNDVVKNEIKNADIILLLISADFNDSDDIWEVEIKEAIERHHKKEARVIPVYIRECDWEGMPYAHLQGLPNGAKPVALYKNKDQAFTEIVDGLKKVIDERRKY